MVPGGNRNKGHDAEREIVKLLDPVVSAILGEKTLHRNLQQTRQGGHDVAGLDFLALEVKRCETLEIEKWWTQTLRQAEALGLDAHPVLMYRQNRTKWTVVMWGMVGQVKMRVSISLDGFAMWLTEELKNRVRSGQIHARWGFGGELVGKVGETS